MVEAFLADTGMSAGQIDRVRYLVGHHHTFTGVEGIDHQILIEADYIANACENGYGAKNIQNFLDRIAKTDAARRLREQTPWLAQKNTPDTLSEPAGVCYNMV